MVTCDKKMEQFHVCQPNNRQFAKLQCFNYDPSPEGAKKKLFDNILNTEIDIVLETPTHLFIGEAKHEMGFGADANLVLVHQLIRQYVVATILLKLLDCNKAGGSIS